MNYLLSLALKLVEDELSKSKEASLKAVYF